MTDTFDPSAVLERLIEHEAIPHDDGDPVFDAPWQARLFGIAVALNEREGRIEWTEFQSLLAEEIANDDNGDRPFDHDRDEDTAVESIYYERWLRALERLAIGYGWVDPAEIRKRAAEFAAGERSAAEFVDGDHERGSDEQHLHVHR